MARHEKEVILNNPVFTAAFSMYIKIANYTPNTLAHVSRTTETLIC